MPTKGKTITLKLKLKNTFKKSQITSFVFLFFFATVLIHVGHSHIRDSTNAVEVESKFFRPCGSICCIG